ncbi:unnamed protein product [Trichobilharzia szidati]|nr:unnamed protein product [Trichobilharzia szidati]
MDIEDITTEHERPENATGVLVKARFKNKKQHLYEDLCLSSSVPEKYRVFVQTWGCAHNTSDSEYMTGLLAKYGYQVTLGGSQNTHGSCESDNIPDGDDDNRNSNSCECQNTGDQCCSRENNNNNKKSEKTKPGNTDQNAKMEAHIWVLNSCTVKGPAEDHFRNAVLEGVKLGKCVVAAGCVPQSRPGADYLKGVSVIGVRQIDRIVEVVEETLQGNVVRFLDKKWTPSSESKESTITAGAALDLPKIRRNPLIEILPISTGCLNSCTYCKTKQARGVLASYPIEQLLDRVRQAFSEGVKELWLTSEDLGAYGRDLDRRNSSLICPTLSAKWPHFITLADLLAGIIPLIPAGCMLRLGMTNPPYILDQLVEIAEVLSHPRVYSFIHIPVQSGSDAVLDAMKREYTVEEFSRVVDYLKENVQPANLPNDVPDGTPNGCGQLTIATDIICGFPNETENDFNQTVQLVEKYHFPVLHINQFFARPGTPAANMQRKATTAEVKLRTRKLHDLFRTYRTYDGRVGCKVRALITEPSFDGKYWVGHTKAYEQILLPKDPSVYGRIVLVQIVECDKFFMRGEIIDPGPFDSIVFPNHPGVNGIDVDNSQSLLGESLKLTNLPELIQNTSSGNIPNGVIVLKDKERLLSKLNNYIRNDKTLVSLTGYAAFAVLGLCLFLTVSNTRRNQLFALFR